MSVEQNCCTDLVTHVTTFTHSPVTIGPFPLNPMSEPLETFSGSGKSRATRVDFERLSELCETVGLDFGASRIRTRGRLSKPPVKHRKVST
jgi:hypothetical protein